MSVPGRIRRGPAPGRPGIVTEALPHLPQTVGMGDACAQPSLSLPPFPVSGLPSSLMVPPAFSCSFPVYSHKGGPLNKIFDVFNPMQSPSPLVPPAIYTSLWGERRSASPDFSGGTWCEIVKVKATEEQVSWCVCPCQWSWCREGRQPRRQMID